MTHAAGDAVNWTSPDGLQLGATVLRVLGADRYLIQRNPIDRSPPPKVAADPALLAEWESGLRHIEVLEAALHAAGIEPPDDQAPFAVRGDELYPLR